MFLKDIKELIKISLDIRKSLDEFRSLSIERSEFNRMYKRVNQIYFNNKDTQLVSFAQEKPVTMSDIMRNIMVDTDLTKIITTTYVSLSVILRYTRTSVQEKEFNEAISTLLVNREKFKINYLNGYSHIFIVSNIDIDAIREISSVFKRMDNFDKSTIISSPSDVGTISKRYPVLFISSTELSVFTVNNKEVVITEHPSFIFPALMYLMADEDDLKTLEFLE